MCFPKKLLSITGFFLGRMPCQLCHAAGVSNLRVLGSVEAPACAPGIRPRSKFSDESGRHRGYPTRRVQVVPLVTMEEEAIQPLCSSPRKLLVPEKMARRALGKVSTAFPPPALGSGRDSSGPPVGAKCLRTLEIHREEPVHGRNATRLSALCFSLRTRPPRCPWDSSRVGECRASKPRASLAGGVGLLLAGLRARVQQAL